ncbi:MAG: prolyl oligopeptidase family serine peptidase [Gemmataceae bacterium]|nr:prolyl oligopeptidase family serine peptidase [Gemmataceae bacterium]MCI0738182.1 prolyl oligopeptidase family serine peptidase [Gemmataceae bacterium]
MRTVRHNKCTVLTMALFLVSFWILQAHGQQVALNKEAYLMPPKEIADAILAPRHENVTLSNLSPDGKKFLIANSDGMPTLERMACPCVYLGETAFDPVAARARQLWIRSDPGFDIYFHADKRTVPVQIPERARVSNPVWSPDGGRLAFFVHLPDATHIYIADADTGSSRRLTTTPVLATMVTSFQWSRDGKQIQTVLLPDDGKRPVPKNHGAPTEPKVRIASDGKNPSRTYRFLLESPHDMKLLEHLATGQLALIDVNDGKVTKIGFPSMLRGVSMCPGGESFRVTLLTKPFSYFVPMARFGSQEMVWDREGKCLVALQERKLQEIPPQPPAVIALAPKQTGGFKGKGKQAQPPQPQPDPDNPQTGGPPVDPDGKRELGWRPDGVGLSYLQLEPGATSGKDEKADNKGASKGKSETAKEKPRKDRLMQWLPPFGKDNAKIVYETPQRLSGAQYSEDCRMLFVTQTGDGQRQIIAVDLADSNKTYVIHKSAAGFGKGGPKSAKDPDVLDPPAVDPPPDDGTVPNSHEFGYGMDEQKKGFGGAGGFGVGQTPSLLTRTGRGEAKVVRISSGGEVYVSGTERAGGAEKGFPKPFIDKVHITTGKKTRIYEGKGETLETIDIVNGDDIQLVFTTRQKKDVVPDSYVTDLRDGKTTKLTNNVDHTPWFHQLETQRIQITRVDGFKFWAKVTLPPKAPNKLPALFWIYPREYTDQAAYNSAAGRTAAAISRFAAPAPRSMALLTLAGYAVVEPDVPIVGPPGRINDNYVPDLRNSLWAVIDELDKRGIIDRDRLAIGGHSYGAFSTANALVHTPFFKAGIAGDGNYNRTLTPMSFQTEKRQLWDARETYLEMSPLLWADRINGALLMYHGMDDANVGTNPINAEYLFMALDGLGKNAALYMYPHEGHGPIARETTLDLWARWVGWLDLYVKNPQKKEAGKKAAGIGAEQ